MNAAIPPFVPRSGVRHVVSVSGGKDSTATYLLALERLGGDFEAVFADTGNEHPYTYEYVARLHERTAGRRCKSSRPISRGNWPGNGHTWNPAGQ